MQAAIGIGHRHSCLVQGNHKINCWGDNGSGEIGEDRVAGADAFQSEDFIAVSAGGKLSCGLKTDHTAQCWGHKAAYSGLAKDKKFLTVAAGDDHVCAIGLDNKMSCRGAGALDVEDPQGSFITVSAGARRNCGVKTNNTLACWGDTVADTPSGLFLAVDTGNGFNCGIKINNTIACWGTDKNDGLKDIPSSNNRSIQSASGSGHSCGIKTDNTLHCWGASTGTVVPSALEQTRLMTVGAGHLYSCGISINRDLECWGELGDVDDHDRLEAVEGLKALAAPTTLYLLEKSENFPQTVRLEPYTIEIKTLVISLNDSPKHLSLIHI